jgi:hypothetical protein
VRLAGDQLRRAATEIQEFANGLDSGQVGKMRLHLRPGVLIPLARRLFHAAGENGFGLVSAVALRQHLGIHLIGRDVVRIDLKQGLEVGFSRSQLALTEAIQGYAVARKGVIRILGQKFFQFLPPGLVLFGHGSLAYYTG